MVHSPALKVYLTDMVAIFSESESCNIYGPIWAKSQDFRRKNPQSHVLSVHIVGEMCAKSQYGLT